MIERVKAVNLQRFFENPSSFSLNLPILSLSLSLSLNTHLISFRRVYPCPKKLLILFFSPVYAYGDWRHGINKATTAPEGCQNKNLRNEVKNYERNHI
jgi:hypothetical protein